MFEPKPSTYLTAIILSLLLLPLQICATPDYAREKRWADEVIPGLVVGEPIYLTQPNNHKFLGIFSQADDTNVGVVVVHGMGLHPDWGMIGTLRQDLNDAGYTTLSVQMPVLAADASYKDYPAIFPDAVERLQIAVRYLKDKGYRRIAIVSHSNGSRMSRRYMLTNPVNVDTWVAISLTQGDDYAGIKVPVLDLYGEVDLPHVVENADKRRKSFKGNPLSRQKIVANADHFFSGQEDKMIGVVKEYLDTL